MEQSKISPIKRFWLLINPDKREIRNIYIYAIFIGLVNLSLPIGIQAIINLIQGGQMSVSWMVLVAFVIFGIAISGILQINQFKITEYLQQKIFTRAAFEFTYRIPKIKLEALYKHYAPELMNRFFDVITIQKGLSKILIDFSTASIQTVFGLILLSLYHPFFIVFSLILILLIYSIFRLSAKKGLETSLRESKSKYNVAHWLEEVARTSVTFKLAGQTDLHMNRSNDLVDHYVSARDAHFKVLINQYGFMILFKVLVAAGFLIVGSILVMEQQMNIGQFVAAEIIILLVLSSVEKLVTNLDTIYDVLTSLEKVGQVTDLAIERHSGMDIKNVSSENGGLSVELKDVVFHYPDQERLIFDKASLKIKEGEKIMIIGDSETGKTTLLYLLAGIYKVIKGAVIFNNIPLNNLNPILLRSTIGDCLMDELLFEGTLLENITMGRENASFENVQWAFDKLGLNSFLKSLPQGYDTKIQTQGKQFSRGIVDKLIIARSIVDKPKLLLIKDAFTSIVGEDRKKIMDFLTSKENTWTLVIASGDQELKKKVDRLILSENGSLIELKK